MSQKACDVIVLVGGLGTRLRGVVNDVPKPLAPVAGRPFLHRLLDRLAERGVPGVVLATGYRGDLVHKSCGERWGHMVVRYSHESEPLGTGGALAAALTKAGGKKCLVINGDTWLDLDYRELCTAGERSGLPLCVTLTRVADVGRYGAAAIDGDRLVGFSEKGQQGPGLINAGIYWLDATIVRYFPNRPTFSFEEEVLPALIDQRSVGIFIGGREFIDIGVPDDYFRSQRLFALPGATM